MSFYSNYAATAAALEELRRQALDYNRSVMLHFSPVTSIDPSAALVFVAEIYRIRNLRSREAVSGTYPRHWDVYELLREMGSFRLLSVYELDDAPVRDDRIARPVYLEFVTDTRVDSVMADELVSVIEKHVMPLNELARTKLVAAIIEAMQNVLDHAQPHAEPGQKMSRRWWMSSRISLAENEVVILFFDQGIGIPGTLHPDLYDRIRAALSGMVRFRSLTAQPSDGQMIMAATEKYRTSTAGSSRGRGFQNMKRFVEQCQAGELRVLSNRGRYSYIGHTDESFGDEEISIGGTVIEWRFRHLGSVDMQDE